MPTALQQIPPSIGHVVQRPQGDPQNEIWTAEDVAAYLRVTARHVTNMAKRGEIPGKRFGTIWRFRRQDIVEFR